MRSRAAAINGATGTTVRSGSPARFVEPLTGRDARFQACSGKQRTSTLQQTGTSQRVAGDQEREHSHAAVVQRAASTKRGPRGGRKED